MTSQSFNIFYMTMNESEMGFYKWCNEKIFIVSLLTMYLYAFMTLHPFLLLRCRTFE